MLVPYFARYRTCVVWVHRVSAPTTERIRFRPTEATVTTCSAWPVITSSRHSLVLLHVLFLRRVRRYPRLGAALAERGNRGRAHMYMCSSGWQARTICVHVFTVYIDRTAGVVMTATAVVIMLHAHRKLRRLHILRIDFRSEFSNLQTKIVWVLTASQWGLWITLPSNWWV